MIRSILVLLLLGFSTLAAGEVQANPGVRGRHEDFTCPPTLRARVNFWKDIFTKYGKYQVVFHHRDYPQVTFGVVDFSREAETLSPIQLDSLKKRVLEERQRELRAVFTSLASGKAPASALEEKIQWEMRGVPGGGEKFKRILDDDLIRTQTGIREKFADAVRRSGRYIGLMEEIFTGYGLPIELTRLPFVESSFDYTAYSSVGAAGIWQFMPRTAKLYMTVGSVVDERRDPIESSKAAAKYLKNAYATLGSWPLAIVSYNHGVAGVSRKVKKMGTTDIAKLVEHPSERVFGFASNNFYPEFLAALEVYDNYRVYFPSIRLEDELKMSQVTLRSSVSIQHVSRQLGLDTDTLRKYNYALMDSVWRGRSRIPAGYTLKVPVSASGAVANLKIPEHSTADVASSTSSVYGGVVYTVRRGDTLSKIAKRYKTTTKELLELNDLKNSLVRVGQKLTVSPREDSAPEPERKSSGGGGSAAVSYRVGSGETLTSIAKRHGTTVSALKRLNGMKSDILRTGQRIRVR